MTDWNGRWVVFDVGETLVDETRVWSAWADVTGTPRLTFMAVLGATIARGGAHQSVFRELGLPHWEHHRDQLEASYGAIVDSDLYPDVRPTLEALRTADYRLAIIGNQPARRTADLRALDLPVEVIAMSDEMGVAKPDAAFFARVIELAGNPDPADVAYAGDRVDNDVIPSAAAGMRAIWVRRGPWGTIQQAASVAPALVVDSLDELVERIGEAWPEPEG
jgi:HAD superfamily hydrolase (TIGR01549 family)